jgi:hypothetical protein
VSRAMWLIGCNGGAKLCFFGWLGAARGSLYRQGVRTGEFSLAGFSPIPRAPLAEAGTQPQRRPRLDEFFSHEFRACGLFAVNFRQNI